MELQGKCIAALAIESGTSKSGNAWQKQNFVIETAGQYPKKVCLQLFGDKVNDCPNVGEEVKVSFDPESREWQVVYPAQRMESGATADSAARTSAAGLYAAGTTDRRFG